MFPRIIKPDVCNEIVKEFSSENLKQGSVSTQNNPHKGYHVPDIRKTSVCFIPTDQSSEANKLCWSFLKEANRIMFNYDLIYFQKIQFAEYKMGDFFDWHIDSRSQNELNKTRKLSLSMMLTDPDTFEGGKFEFYNGGKSLEVQKNKDDFKETNGVTMDQYENDLKAQGTVVVFDSRDWHRVTPITKGIRHSLVCWATGPDFK